MRATTGSSLRWRPVAVRARGLRSHFRGGWSGLRSHLRRMDTASDGLHALRVLGSTHADAPRTRTDQRSLRDIVREKESVMCHETGARRATCSCWRVARTLCVLCGLCGSDYSLHTRYCACPFFPNALSPFGGVPVRALRNTEGEKRCSMSVIQWALFLL